MRQWRDDVREEAEANDDRLSFPRVTKRDVQRLVADKL